MSGTRFAVIGTGLLGGWILELLARTPVPARIVAIDRDGDRGLRKVNAVARGSRIMGSRASVEFRRVDLANLDQLTETLAEIRPDVVMQTASLQAWWVVNSLPKAIYDRVAQAGLGAWLPMHLAPTANVMRALHSGALSPIVVNAPFPDAVNAALGEFAPTVGLGNMDELVPMIEAEVARRMALPECEVRVWMVGHHFHNAALLDHGTTGGAPYFLRIDVAGEDVTDRWPRDELLLAATRNYPLGSEDTPMIASSAIKNAMALLAGSASFTHAPGPLALPGGYPVRLGAGKVELALPPGLSREEAIRLNMQAQRFDGIETIGADGKVRCTEESVAIMREVFGFDSSEYSVDAAWEQARELSAAYRRVAERA